MKILKEETNDLDVGQKIEYEHLPTLNKIKNFVATNNTWPDITVVASWIRDDHLSEFINYYDSEIGLPQMERELEKLKNK
jgi:hypothetical protein